MEEKLIFPRRVMKPVTLYLEELFWLESKLVKLYKIGRVIFDFNKNFEVLSSFQMELNRKNQKTLDNLTLEYGQLVIQFHKRKTIIEFKSLGQESEKVFYEVCEYLENKQRFLPFAKQKIHFFVRPIGKNPLTQEKTPLWLTLLMFIIGLLFEDGIQIIKDLLTR